MTRFNPIIMGMCVYFAVVGTFPSHSQENPFEAKSLSPELFNAIRNNDVSLAASILDSDSEQLNARDGQGSTSLIHAALYADENCVRLLLERGADPNAINETGVSALMQVSGSLEKARVLLDAGAEVNAQSDIGNTPLIRSAVISNSAPLLQLLLDSKADVNLCNVYGVSPLIAAAMSGDPDNVRLLVDRGVELDVELPMNIVDKKGNTQNGNSLTPFFSGGQSALMWSALLGQEESVKLLLERGANVNAKQLFGTPLSVSAWRGKTEIARLLLDHGAQVDQGDQFIGNFTPLLWACTSDTTESSYIELLVQKGADANAKGGDVKSSFMEDPQTPLLWTMRQGRKEAAELLVKQGAATPEDSWSRRNPLPPTRNLPDGPIPSKAIAQAVLAAIPPLEKSGVESSREFITKGQNCTSCHNQLLPLIALSAVKKKGIPRSESVAQELRESYKKPFDQLGREIHEPNFHPAPGIEFGYALMGLAEEGLPADRYTDAYVSFLLANQAKDGRWYNYIPRPPIMSSDVCATAWGIQGLALYPLPGRKDEIKARIEQAAQWLKNNEPRFTDERVFQLLGLSWAGESPESLKAMAMALIAEQREDGGWAQTSGLSSDAYATGSVLYALNEAAGIPSDHPSYQKGIRYLLTHQLEEGTWFVRRRAYPFQPTMRSGFPHGRDGWISSAATAWAILALTAAVDPKDTADLERMEIAAAPLDFKDKLPPPVDRNVDFAKDIQPILNTSCFGCHGSTMPRSKYQVDSYEHLFVKGEQGYQNIIPGDSANSPMVHYVSGLVEDMEMPPSIVRAGIPALTSDEIALLRAWIDQGAKGSAEKVAAQ